jgi:hypothetical protein
MSVEFRAKANASVRVHTEINKRKHNVGTRTGSYTDLNHILILPLSHKQTAEWRRIHLQNLMDG